MRIYIYKYISGLNEIVFLKVFHYCPYEKDTSRKIFFLKKFLPKTDRLTSSNLIIVFLFWKKQNYYANLNHKLTVDNAEFWRTVKTTFFENIKSDEKMAPAKDVTITKFDTKNGEFFNSFFLNFRACKNLQMRELNAIN